MKSLDFLSSSPSIYLLNEKRGKNKVGGFFSILFTLVMITLLIYYIYIYFFGLEYNLIFYRDFWEKIMNDEQKESIKKPRSFILVLYLIKTMQKLDLYLLVLMELYMMQKNVIIIHFLNIILMMFIVLIYQFILLIYKAKKEIIH